MHKVELYAKKTSTKAKKLIIDLFNKINEGKPYKMKTITTIYQNDDIFKDNQRYPIDAPFQMFYEELTINYVPKHNLDNIFFEKNGEPKTGKYFFEYFYDNNNNKFLIFTFPKELGKLTSKKYVPMLHSMVTGEQIDWESAIKNTIFFKKRKEETAKILLVFGKDTLKTLKFSWLATFNINGTYKKSYNIFTEIMAQAENIMNFTRGVLFSEVDNLVFQFNMQVKSHARKAAIAALMSRNLSHNIGSHVLVDFIGLSTYENDKIKQFSNYLKQRMSFISDISISYPYQTFESDTKKIINDFFDIKNKYLLSFLPGIENLKVKEQNGDYIFPIYHNVTPKGNEPIYVDFPNDILGHQALYVVIENIIRNAARHSLMNKTNKFTFSFSEDINFPEYYTLDIVDDLGILNMQTRDTQSFLKNTFNDKFDKSVLDDGKLRKGGWGLLEMKIAAAYLRKLDETHIDLSVKNEDAKEYIEINGEKHPPIIRAYFVNTDGKVYIYNLGFRIYLLKPKIAIVYHNDNELQKKESDLKKYGITLVQGKNDNISETEHQFAVVVEMGSKTSSFNQRFINGDEAALTNIKKQLIANPFNLTSFKTFLWDEWIKKIDRTLKEKVLRCVGANCNCWSKINTNKYIVLDNHSICRNCKDDIKCFYYEGGDSQTYIPEMITRYNDANNDLKNILENEYREMAFAKVMVIDERIQKQIYLKQDNSVGLLLEKKGIFVPTKDQYDLDQQTYSKVSDLKKYIMENLVGINFFIIHLSILEKLVGIEKNDSTKIAEKIKELLNGTKPDLRVIIISERSKQENIPNNSYFLYFSLVEQFLVKKPSKYHLTKLLYQTRRLHT